MLRLSTEQRMQIGFIVAIIALIGVSLVAFRTIDARQSSAKQRVATESRLLATSRLLGSIDAASSTQNEFMLFGDSGQLEQRRTALKSAHADLELLQSLTRSEPELTRYSKFDVAAADMLRLLEVELVLYTSAGQQAIKNSAIPQQLQNTRQALSDLLAKAIDLEQTDLKSLQKQESGSGAMLYIVQSTASLFAFATLLWLAFYIRSELAVRRRAENQLRDTNTYVESLIENIPAMIFIKDARELRFVRINKAGEALLGIKREELIGKSDRDFFPANQVQFFINKDREVLAQDKAVEIPEETIDTRTQGQRWLHTLKVPVMDAQNQPMLLMGISMDITRQKLAEQRVKALVSELEHNAKLLKASNSELETFCYSVSHDLRAPLRTIEGFAQLLEEGYKNSLDDPALQHLNAIRRSSKHMAQLIDDLLAYARVGRQAITLKTLDMNILVSKATEVAAFGRNPRPTIIIDQLPPASGDETMLSSVWLNLVDNAIKYSAKNVAPVIHISAHHDKQGTTYCVQDNGVGFDMQNYEKLFDVFQRLHSERDFAGTGLGLAIVERIITRHGGRIWADGKPSLGAAFYFSLPTVAETIAS